MNKLAVFVILALCLATAFAYTPRPDIWKKPIRKFIPHDEEEADFPWVSAAIGAYNLYKKFKKDDAEADIILPVTIGKLVFDKLRRRDNVESDDFKRDVLAPVLIAAHKVTDRATKGAQSMVPHIPALLDIAAKLAGARKDDDEVESEKINWGKVFSPENIQKAVEIYKIIRSKDNEAESDAEFFKKLGGLVKKVAPVAKKGFDIYNKAKGFGILAESEKLNLRELIQKIKEKIRARLEKQKKQPEQPAEPEADAEFFKKLGGLVKKAVPVVKKGLDVYKTVKGAGILADSEAEFFGKLIKKLKAKKQKQQPAEEPESEKINWGKVFSPENIQKAVEIYKIIRSKDNVVESDAEAEFFKKLGGLVKKVAPVAKKGFDIYNKAKGFGILAESQTEASCADMVQQVRNQLRYGSSKSVEELCIAAGLPKHAASLVRAGLPTELICKKI